MKNLNRLEVNEKGLTIPSGIDELSEENEIIRFYNKIKKKKHNVLNFKAL